MDIYLLKEHLQKFVNMVKKREWKVKSKSNSVNDKTNLQRSINLLVIKLTFKGLSIY